jgi:hypothetical protein
MKNIRDLFSTRRPIDRRIEKVIDYYADDESRLAIEIDEYEATDNVESCFRKFLDNYQAGVQSGQVTEVGIWVAGFYGSGKSSFTKYLGFALDPEREVEGQVFLKLLADRLRSVDIRAQLLTVAKNNPTAVVMLDLGSEQLADSTAATVTNVLYWKVLQTAGYSKEKKLAQLEFTLDQRNLYDGFKSTYQQRYGGSWEDIHNDPLLGVRRASEILPEVMPQDFPDSMDFLKLRFEMSENVRDIAQRMIDIIRKHTGQENILILIDEAGQYVAPRGELILNLDGLARNLKELGQGKVWIMATGQQTLTEIVERAAHNTPELNKLKDRFPISIELDARDIREITYRRLLTKSDVGVQDLNSRFDNKGQAMIRHTRLTGTKYYKDDPTPDEFARFYPFLPQHFDILMELIRVLARSTGGIGLRSAIRVIQDVLVDSSRILPPDETKLADRSVGTLATVDDFYKTLRADLNKLMPHVVNAVDKVERLYSDQPLLLQVAQAVAALQPLEEFPRTAENIAALLYPRLGNPSLEDEVREALGRLVGTKEIGLIEDPQANGYLFLSESVGPLRTKRTSYIPSSGELTRVRNEILRDLLEPQPSARLENIKDVRAAVKMGRHWLTGEREDIRFQLEIVSGEKWDEHRKSLLVETAQQSEYRNTILWLFRRDDVAEDILPEIVKSEYISSPNQIDERTADRDVAQYARSERRLAERNREKVEALLRDALLSGTYIFRGRPTPVRQAGDTVEAASKGVLGKVAGEVFHQYHLVKIRPDTKLARRFLEVERLDHMPRDRDPLGLVVQKGGSPRIDVNHPALAETLRAFRAKVDENGVGRLTGKAIQDFFAADPYGWSKDAVRYLFAALLIGGEVEFHVAGEVIKTSGPGAEEAVKSTLSFNKIGIGPRDSKISPETLDRAARRLQKLFGDDVLPLEDYISQATRKYMPEVIEQVGTLPARLRLLELKGEERAQDLIGEITALLRGDAGDAPSRLGAPDNNVLEEINWARAAIQCLDESGERDIRRANRLLNDLDELYAIYPEECAGIAPEDELEDVRSILSSEHFYEQIPDLRSAVRKIFQRVKNRYRDRLTKYRQQVKSALISLENRRDWIRLEQNDQEEIARRLQITLPNEPDATDPIADYKALLISSYSLPGQLSQLEAEVTRRQPIIDGGDGPEIETLSLRSIRPPQVIANRTDLEVWLEELRALIQERLDSGKHVRFE